ncbi:MAG: flavin reductase family protein [Pseudomonadota bacterium]
MSSLTKKELFLEAMRGLASTVCVLTCRDEEGQCYGMTATSMTSLSLDPISVLACVNRESDFHKSITHSPHFCVNILSSAQAEQCRIFGSGRYRDERFLKDWSAEPATGAPMLIGAQSNLICSKDGGMRYGTHEIVIGRILDVHLADESAPLVWFNSGFLNTEHAQSTA